MALIRDSSGKVAADVPGARVGLLQNEAEMPRTPAYDLFPFLTACEAWDVQLFTERTFGGVAAPSGIDALVVGYNAIHFSEAIREAFSTDPPATHLVILHQLGPECLAFLKDQLLIRTRPMPSRIAAGAWLPKERTLGYEVLLNWPAPVPSVEKDGDEVRMVDAGAWRYLDFEPSSAWRVVLEARTDSRAGRQRLPVVVRTADFLPQRVVVSTLLLEPNRDAALLQNIVTYAAIGHPEVAVLDPGGEPRTYDPTAITERLRLQGARTIRVPLQRRDVLPLTAWPLKGVQRIVVPSTIDYAAAKDSAGGSAWLQRGGTLVRVSPEGLTIHTGATDVHWVARRWAVWFNGCRPEQWLKSLFATRAVLRMLKVLRDSGVARGDLGVAVDPPSFERQVAGLLASRLRRGSAEETVGATAAAWDLRALVGDRAISPHTAGKVEGWLRDRFEDEQVCLEDKLDIARCLGDRKLLKRAIDATRPADASATLAIRLREAVLSCPDRDGALLAVGEPLVAALDGARVTDELRASPLLSAEFLTAWFRCRTEASDHPLATGAPHVRATALNAMTSLAGLAHDTWLDRSDAYTVTVEARALLAYLQAEEVSAFHIRPEARELPVKAVESVLSETRRAREEEDRARRDVSALGAAVHVFGALALAAAAIVMAGVLRILNVEIGATASWWAAATVAVAAVLLALLRWVVLPWLGRREGRELRLAQFCLGVLVVMIMAAAATAGVRAVNGVVAPVFVIGGVVFVGALLAYGLSRYRLSPPWMSELLAIVTDPRSGFEWLRGRRSPPTAPS